MSSSALYRALILLAAVVGLQGCEFYYAREFNARLVDADTGQPIEGAIVVAHWQILGGLEGGNPLGEAMIMETMTDKSGAIHFDSWSGLSWKFGGIRESRPALLIFKNGYEYLNLTNQSRPSLIDDVILRSDWDRKTIGLQRFKASLEEYARVIEALDNAMRFSRFGRDCEWKRTPRMLTAIHQMANYFDSRAVSLPQWRTGGRMYRVDDVDAGSTCGSPAQYFEPFLKQEYTK